MPFGDLFAAATAARSGAPAPEVGLQRAGSDFTAAWNKLAAGSYMGIKPGGGWIEFAPPMAITPPVTSSPVFQVPGLARNPVPIPGISTNPVPNLISWSPGTPSGGIIPGAGTRIIDAPIPSPRSFTVPGNPVASPASFPGVRLPGVNPLPVGITQPAWNSIADLIPRITIPSNGGASVPSTPAGGVPASGLQAASLFDPKKLGLYLGLGAAVFLVYNVGKHNTSPRKRARRRR